ncbi:MAG: sigma-70 family RNA polymerase sigma factor [Deltaproteobacteria bacterium]|nr:sigma-70 family RNA polymerase sigma factor [Candidatus Zymogenaceae bacterium]
MKTINKQEHDKDFDAMEAAANGHPWGFEYLVRKHQGALINYFFRFTQNIDTAKELSQEVFLRLYKARLRYRPDSKFTTYLFTIAHNLVVNEVFVKKRPESTADSNGAADAIPSKNATPEDTLIDEENKRKVHDALGRLNERERSAMVMKYTEGLSYAEIAEIIGASIPAVESLLSRAKDKMRTSLAGSTPKKRD